MTSTRKTGLSAEPGTPSDRERFNEALERARRLCASREYCIHDIRKKLNSWNIIHEIDQENIIASLQKERFIDDDEANLLRQRPSRDWTA